MLLAEANQWPEDTQDYFGDGDECHMAFHFPLMPRMYMAIAQEDRFPITDIMRQTPEIPDNCQWAIFLRNHDELTLEMVTDAERDYLWETYAADRRARINLGIRRRLAPLLERDRRRIELMNCLLLSMPGTPVIYYGDEIGMGDNIHLGDRDGVRTPMQWSPDRNGGFSRADPAALVLPPIMDPLYGYEAVNVEAQARDPHSLLQLDAAHARRCAAATPRSAAARCASSIRGTARSWPICASTRARRILCVANLSRTPQAVELDLSEFAGRVPVELTGGSLFPPIGQLTYLLTLPPYGFYWFVLASESDAPVVAHAGARADAGLRHPGAARRARRAAATAASRVARARGAAGLSRASGAGSPPRTRTIAVDAHRLCRARLPAATASIAAGRGRGHDRRRRPSATSLPLGDRLGGRDRRSRCRSQLALARVRRGRRVGLLTDAFAVAGFARAMLQALRRAARSIDTAERRDRVRADAEALDESCGCTPTPPVRWLSAEQSNSSLIVGDARDAQDLPPRRGRRCIPRPR